MDTSDSTKSALVSDSNISSSPTPSQSTWLEKETIVDTEDIELTTETFKTVSQYATD